MADLYGLKNCIRITPEFCEMLKERLAPRLTKRSSNWRKLLCAGLKIVLTLLHLAISQSYKSFHYQFRTGVSTSLQLIVPACRATQNITEYLRCHLGICLQKGCNTINFITLHHLTSGFFHLGICLQKNCHTLKVFTVHHHCFPLEYVSQKWHALKVFILDHFTKNSSSTIESICQKYVVQRKFSH